QLLIALNRADLGEDSSLFNEWLIHEWEREGKIFGKYQRETREKSVHYESLSVYYYLATYFKVINQNDLETEVIDRTKQLTKKTNSTEVHFFDFIHARKLLD